MPIYEIECKVCGKHDDVYRKVSEYNDLPECCGAMMERVICAPAVMADIQPYQSMATGEWITSRSQHREHLQSRGLVEIGDQHEQHQKHIEQNREAKKKEESRKLKQEIADRINSIT